MTILSITIAVAITIILFTALIKQTMRAERAEAALAKVEATVAECGKAIVHYVDEPVYELGKLDPVSFAKTMKVTGDTEAPRSDAAKTLLDGMRKRAAKLDNPIDLTDLRGATLTPVSDGAASKHFRIAATGDGDGSVNLLGDLRIVPNFMTVDYTDPATGINSKDVAAVYLDGEEVRARSYNIREGWIEEAAPARRYGTVTVTLNLDKDGGLA